MPRPRPLLLALALLPASLPATAAAAVPLPATAAVAQAPMLSVPFGTGSALTLPLRALDPAEYRVVRRPSAATVVVHWPARRHCATTTLRLRTVRDRRDAQTWLRENSPPSDLAFETLQTATVPTSDGLGRQTYVVGAGRMLVGILNGSTLSQRVVTAVRVRSGRLAVLSQTTRTLDLVKHPRTACGGVTRFEVGRAFAEIRTGLVSALQRRSVSGDD